MKRPGRTRWTRAAALGLLTLLSATSISHAQAPPSDVDARLRQQDEQIKKLQQQLDALLRNPTTPAPAPAAAVVVDDPYRVESIVNGILARKDEEAKEKAAAEKASKEKEGYVVGSQTTKDCTFGWDPNVNGWVFATAHRDFTFHPEARIQMDWTFWTQSPALRSASQVGDLEDGIDFRRVRIHFDGTAWEVVEYNFEFALENIQSGILTDDEQFVGLTQIPLIGSIRMGHMRIPHGLEGDMATSSKSMQFMERSSMTDAIFEGYNFAPGIWAGNNFLDQRVTYASMFYRTEQNGTNSADYGDGEYAATGRLTALPIYACEGRELVHLGISSTWQAAEKTGQELGGPTVIQQQARPELRDFQGGFPSSSGTLLPGDSSRLVNTGAVTCRDYLIQAAEFMGIFGPLSFQGEAAFGTMVDAVVPGNKIPGAKGVTVGDINTWGGYISASYFLTGENRLYDKRLGRGSSIYVKPNTPFWVVGDENGGVSTGLGAWELVARYSYINLNDGPVQGGVMQGVTLGLNWYLNTNLKIQFDYVDDQRWHRLPGGQIGAAANSPGAIAGAVQGFGVRTQIFF